jgi:pimeloyl-ACP methyl ester carboxylesterase
MARFRELPDELDSFEEFTQRVIEYTGRPREQVQGALKYSIRQRSDGKWIWKSDKFWRIPGRRESGYTQDQLWDCVRKLECPTLVVRGSDSDVFPAETMQQMEEIIPGCETVTISGAGHLVQGDNPADFVTAVNKILTRVR